MSRTLQWPPSESRIAPHASHRLASQPISHGTWSADKRSKFHERLVEMRGGVTREVRFVILREATGGSVTCPTPANRRLLSLSPSEGERAGESGPFCRQSYRLLCTGASRALH